MEAAQATKPPGGQIAPMVQQQQVPEPVKPIPVQEPPVLEKTCTQVDTIFLLKIERLYFLA